MIKLFQREPDPADCLDSSCGNPCSHPHNCACNGEQHHQDHHHHHHCNHHHHNHNHHHHHQHHHHRKIMINKVETAGWPTLFFYLTLGSVVLLSMANGMYQVVIIIVAIVAI